MSWNIHNSSTFSSKSWYALDKRSPSKCKFWDFRLLGWKLTKFLMLFFKPHVSFPLNFASPYSVMTQNSSEIFQLKHMVSTKQAYQCTIFQTYECSILWNFTHFLMPSLFSVMKVNSSVFFKLKSQLLWTKITYRSEILELLSSWVKFTKSLMSYLKPQISFSLHHPSMSWEITRLYFFSWNFI